MLTHPVVQDLAFIIESECIYQDFDLSAYWVTDVTERLQQLNDNPELIVVTLQEVKSHFLGCYFEHLFSYAIKHLSELDIVFEHVQVIEDKKTLGEVDMLVKTPHGTVHQFELAIEFYLYTISKDQEFNDVKKAPFILLGPNKNDNFQKKYRRAKQHQLTILDTPAAQKLLNSYFVDRKVDRHLLMFGYLYAQLTDPTLLVKKLSVSKDKALDSLVNPASMQGWWLYLKDIMSLYDIWESAQELSKLEWFADINRAINTNDHREACEKNKLFTQFESFHQNIKQKFIQDERPRHFIISCLIRGEVIRKRFFIVPNSW